MACEATDPSAAIPAGSESPAKGQPPAVQVAFARLRGQFLAGLPKRWWEIETAATPILQQAALHRLAGASGSFGLSALGTAARRAETLCLVAAPATLCNAMAHLRQELSAAGATLP